MISLYAIWTVARFEARLLWRSWAFRLFSGLALVFLLFFNFIVLSPLTNTPHYLRAVAGHLPLFNLKFFNIYQGVVAAFLAAEFIKRDRRQDTIETIFVRSFTNLDYILGKLLGLLVLFGGLQGLMLLGLGAGHRLFADVPFAWQAYLWLPLLVTWPTLLLTVGLTWLLIALLRHQAVVLVCVLGLSFLSVVLGERFYYSVDIFAFSTPLAYSDFVGLGQIEQVLRLRAVHVIFGLICIGLTGLLMPRLRQSRWALVAALVLVLGGAAGGTWLGTGYIQGQQQERAYRQQLRRISVQAAPLPSPQVTDYQLALQQPGPQLSATVQLGAVNPHGAGLDSLLFSLNPGLEISRAQIDGRTVRHQRQEHLVWLVPPTPLEPRDSCRVELTYRGTIDPLYCYLDIDDERFFAPYAFWLFRPPKAYAFVGEDFLHLTPESGWYPVAGLSAGAAFPAAARRDFHRFQLTATVPDGWTGFSQGAAVVDSIGGALSYRFQPDQPLAQISLTAAPYRVRRVEVDGIDYSLATLPGHDYFAAYFDSVGPVLAQTIRGLKNEYEAALGLEYPHPRLGLVEVPIQFFSYRRLWTVAQETVQPELVFLPEMGTLLEGADFQRLRRQATRSQERANQAEGAQQLQADYLRTMARVDLLGLQDPGSTDLSRNKALESRWHILPQYLSYQTRVSSRRWPVLNYAFEAYFQERIAPPANTWNRQWRGLTESERANLVLQEHALAELLDRSGAAGDVEEALRQRAIRAKGRQLLLLLAVDIGLDDFDQALTQWVNASRQRAIADSALLVHFEELGAQDPGALLEAWYRQPELPGYQVGHTEAYLVRDGERTRTQVELELANPTSIDGLVKLNFRFRQDELTSWWERQRKGWDYARVVPVPANSRRRLGLLLDQRPAELIVDTYAARNIPSLVYFAFGEQTLRRDARPFAGLDEGPILEATAGEWVVDNEDEGFERMTVRGTSRLRRFLLDLFDKEERTDLYVGLRSWDPPGTWQATTDHRLYGRFVRSGYYKKSGQGRSRVSWQTPIAEAGVYDIYFFCGLLEDMQQRKKGADGEEGVHFVVHHDGGIDDVSMDRPDLEQGWNHLGQYRLGAGPARVELTDRSSARLVVADAVKWVKESD
ncbi:MAG: hypothetical protein GKR89_21425 [Candidatus Latescibacteria bacterium]|nr:hypothetical protein [Candidatus Latescibacterota bacterium]